MTPSADVPRQRMWAMRSSACSPAVFAAPSAVVPRSEGGESVLGGQAADEVLGDLYLFGGVLDAREPGVADHPLHQDCFARGVDGHDSRDGHLGGTQRANDLRFGGQ